MNSRYPINWAVLALFVAGFGLGTGAWLLDGAPHGALFGYGGWGLASVLASYATNLARRVRTLERRSHDHTPHPTHRTDME